MSRDRERETLKLWTTATVNLHQLEAECWTPAIPMATSERSADSNWQHNSAYYLHGVHSVKFTTHYTAEQFRGATLQKLAERNKSWQSVSKQTKFDQNL